ncbi:thiol reductant ABC exporter subunit CydD [Buchananella felis]|uniref:thiol reductant ABC exporter subunit CydD n=1 Tax=Buchananella felis TaxID=3231492 RepID=UPI00352963E3
MKPLDPRLLRYARAARSHVTTSALLGILLTALTIVQAIALGKALAHVIHDGWTLAAITTPLAVAATALLARAAATFARERLAHRAATAAVRELRAQGLAAAVARGPRWAAANASQTTTLLTRGLEDLRPYFVSYLPQLVLAMTLTPATIVVIWFLDPTSAYIAVGTIPLIPLFMILVGLLTRDFAASRLKVMNQLGAELLDLLAGLPTLRAFGRQDSPRRRVRELGERYTTSTMQTLRVAFLSGSILEFLATLSVALIAVSIGMRMVYGYLSLEAGLIVLLLAPEVYAPLRAVGAQFHASSDGVAAADAACSLIESAPAVAPVDDAAAVRPSRQALTGARLTFSGVGVPSHSGLAPAGAAGVIEPGRVTALVGPSGAGKTTLALCLARLLDPAEGTITLEQAGDGQAIDLASVPPEAWHEHVEWVAQRPLLLPGTLREVTLAGRQATDEELEAAAGLSGLDQIVAQHGWDAPLGHGGVGLSVGQRQRVALTRALLSDKPLVIMDEPSAHLDYRTEERVLGVLDELRRQGRTVVVIAHRPRLVAAADHIINVYAEVAA